jgi:hypothetical protein
LWVMPREPYCLKITTSFKQESKRLPLYKLIINGF